MPNAIIMEDQGPTGAYNRANRSLTHMVENFGIFVAGLFLTGTVFPEPAFALTCVFCAGRIAHQVGYTTGYGGHGLGFALSMLACVTMEGLLTACVVNSW